MGWGDCGTDSNGRPIGYVFPATCDHPDCNKEIHRGLSYACGDMHGETEHGCEKYFCSDHLSVCVQTDDDRLINICEECGKAHLEDGEWIENDDGVLVRNQANTYYTECPVCCHGGETEVGVKCPECGKGKMTPSDVEPWD